MHGRKTDRMSENMSVTNQRQIIQQYITIYLIYLCNNPEINYTYIIYLWKSPISFFLSYLRLSFNLEEND